LSYIGADPFVSSDPIQIAQADRLVFPGVGAFGDCMEELRARDLLDALGEYRLKERPLLGICVGLQLLFEESEEFGPLKGLGWLNGKVRQLHPRPGFKVPHMGWSRVRWQTEGLREGHPVVQGTDQDAYYYFVHSFHAEPDDERLICGRVWGGADHVGSGAVGTRSFGICAAVATGAILAVQFHPEKSDHAGLRLLSSFAQWSP